LQAEPADDALAALEIAVQQVQHQELLGRAGRPVYVASADVGFWQGALRDPADPLFAAMRAAATASTSVPAPAPVASSEAVPAQSVIYGGLAADKIAGSSPLAQV
jgi:hypothetical protein